MVDVELLLSDNGDFIGLPGPAGPQGMLGFLQSTSETNLNNIKTPAGELGGTSIPALKR